MMSDDAGDWLLDPRSVTRSPYGKNITAIAAGFAHGRVVWLNSIPYDLCLFLRNEHALFGALLYHPMHPFGPGGRVAFFVASVLVNFFSAAVVFHFTRNASIELFLVWLALMACASTVFEFSMKYIGSSSCCQPGGACEWMGLHRTCAGCWVCFCLACALAASITGAVIVARNAPEPGAFLTTWLIEYAESQALSVVLLTVFFFGDRANQMSCITDPAEARAYGKGGLAFAEGPDYPTRKFMISHDRCGMCAAAASSPSPYAV